LFELMDIKDRASSILGQKAYISFIVKKPKKSASAKVGAAAHLAGKRWLATGSRKSG
jgi:hypothetical protein